jgi:glutathione synthase/RimK-type ligase-like ATP-grasp enzyme
VVSAIEERGGWALVCDTAAFPAETRVCLRDGKIVLGGRTLARLPGSVYLRGLSMSPLSPQFEEDLRTRPLGLFAQCEESSSLLASLVRTLQELGVPIINGLEANAQHSRKPYQLALLRRAGLPVPRWLATNDPDAVREFAKAMRRIVYKPVGGGATVQRLEPKDLTDDRLAALRYAPVLFQELVEGVSVRVYVAGNRAVAAAEIHSQELDYRRGEEAVIATRLTREERSVAVKAARKCGMRFAGVDLIRGKRRFVVLECNPSPMFAVFEDKTGLDVAGPLAELLLG